MSVGIVLEIQRRRRALMQQRLAEQPATQVLRPPRVVDGDAVHAPLAQQVPTEADLLDPKIADAIAKLRDPSTDAKQRKRAHGILKKARAKAASVLKADRKGLAYRKESPRKALQRIGNYSPEAWEAIYALTIRERPAALAALDDKGSAKDRRIRDERSMVAKIQKERPDLTSRRAKEAARRLGRKSHRVIETRAFPKK